MIPLYRAATLFTRLYCPESAMGSLTTEEAEDMAYANAQASPAPYSSGSGSGGHEMVKDRETVLQALNARIPEAKEKLMACDPEVVRRHFEDRGFMSMQGDWDMWLDDVMAQVTTVFILDSIVMEVEKESSEKESE